MKYSNDARDFVSVGEEIPDVLLDIRYYSSFNFIGERVDGYDAPAALLTREAAQALKAVCEEAKGQGLRLKVFDAYRPQKAVDHFVRWAKDPADIRMKAYFYPDLDKSQVIPQGYIAEHSGHSRGSTVDLTLLDEKTGMLLMCCDRCCYQREIDKKLVSPAGIGCFPNVYAALGGVGVDPVITL